MSPRSAFNDLPDIAAVNAECFGYGRKRRSAIMKAPDLQNVGRAELPSRDDIPILARAANATAATLPTPLLSHVFRVFLGRSRKQVGWIHARRIVASVADKHPVWNRSVMNFPRHPMGINSLSAFAAPVDHSIARLEATPRPFPTRLGARWDNISPKTGLKWYWFGSHLSLLAAWLVRGGAPLRTARHPGFLHQIIGFS